jgi:hypothetical protein
VLYGLEVVDEGGFDMGMGTAPVVKSVGQ